MSYSFSVPAVPKGDLGQAIRDAGAVAVSTMHEPHREPAADHIGAIARAAQEVAEFLGRPEDHVGVTISGHANEGHAPSDGWADEMVSLSFSIVRAPEVDPEVVVVTDESPEAVTG